MAHVIVTIDEPLETPITITIVGRGTTVVTAGEAAAPGAATTTAAVDPVENILERFEAYDPNTMARAVHSKLLDAGWTVLAPKSRKSPGEVSERAYLRYLVGSGAKRVTVYLDTIGLGCYMERLQPVLLEVTGYRKHTRGATFPFEAGRDAVFDAIDTLTNYAAK